MTKFKVGDRVTLKEGVATSYWTHGKEYIVTRAYHECGYERITTNTDNNGSDTNGWLVDKFELFKPKSPVREVTKKVVVSGEYDSLSVYYVGADLRIEMNRSKHTPQQLREAAKNLIKIAEVLEENDAND